MTGVTKSIRRDGKREQDGDGGWKKEGLLYRATTGVTLDNITMVWFPDKMVKCKGKERTGEGEKRRGMERKEKKRNEDREDEKKQNERKIKEKRRQNDRR